MTPSPRAALGPRARHIILYRVNGGHTQAVTDPDTGEPWEFPDRWAADAYAARNRLFASGQVTYQVVELT